MCYSETKKLIDKYDCQYVPGEQQSPSTKKTNRNYNKLQERYRILEDTLQTLHFPVTQNEKEQIQTLIRKYNNQFKTLHHNASQETIITAMIITIKKAHDPTITYDLNNNIILTITSRILEDYMKNTPIIPQTTYKYDHEILLKENPIQYK